MCSQYNTIHHLLPNAYTDYTHRKTKQMAKIALLRILKKNFLNLNLQNLFSIWLWWKLCSFNLECLRKHFMLSVFKIYYLFSPFFFRFWYDTLVGVSHHGYQHVQQENRYEDHEHGKDKLCEKCVPCQVKVMVLKCIQFLYQYITHKL